MNQFCIQYIIINLEVPIHDYVYASNTDIDFLYLYWGPMNANITNVTW